LEEEKEESDYQDDSIKTKKSKNTLNSNRTNISS